MTHVRTQMCIWVCFLKGPFLGFPGASNTGKVSYGIWARSEQLFGIAWGHLVCQTIGRRWWRRDQDIGTPRKDAFGRRFYRWSCLEWSNLSVFLRSEFSHELGPRCWCFALVCLPTIFDDMKQPLSTIIDHHNGTRNMAMRLFPITQWWIFVVRELTRWVHSLQINPFQPA